MTEKCNFKERFQGGSNEQRREFLGELLALEKATSQRIQDLEIKIKELGSSEDLNRALRGQRRTLAEAQSMMMELQREMEESDQRVEDVYAERDGNDGGAPYDAPRRLQ